MNVADILVHLRLPFSFFLAPIFLFALTLLPEISLGQSLLFFAALHFFLYSSSNAYNSYYDKDDGPIGGIERPPAVDRSLLWVSLCMELVGLVMLAFISLWAVVFMVIYGLLSKAYSWDKIRWKRLPIFSLGGIALTQGSLVVLTVVLCSAGGPLSRFPAAPDATLGAVFAPIPWLGALAAALFLTAVYPLTQVYQHEQDAARGDMTYSRLVGIRGTFLHSALAFTLALAAFGGVFVLSQGPAEGVRSILLLAGLLAPALVYFFWWWLRVLKDETAANFKNTMRMNLIASAGMNLYFIIQLLA